jgi:hypothetical protein
MYKLSTLGILLLSCALFLSCTASQKQGGREASVQDASKPEEKQKVSVQELRRLYEAGKSQYERRAVCLRAIDEGLIRRGAPVSTIDEIFGTRFASDLPTKEETTRETLIKFADQFSPPPVPEGHVTQGVASVGWYIAIDYNYDGAIQNYFLTNLHKGNLSSVDENEVVSATELRRLYENAKSEDEKRQVCLRAIDGGAIRTLRHVSSIDEIFGTHFANDLPTRKEGTRKASVDFGSSPGRADNSTKTAQVGWFLTVEYGDDGSLYNYSLSNMKK